MSVKIPGVLICAEQVGPSGKVRAGATTINNIETKAKRGEAIMRGFEPRPRPPGVAGCAHRGLIKDVENAET